MWIVTPYGFFSIVCAVDVAADDGVSWPIPADQNLMMIRARCREHLVALRERYGGLPEIIDNEGTDYPYRIIAGRCCVERIVNGLLKDVDYTNFKDKAHAVQEGKPNAKQWRSFLNAVWHQGFQLQPPTVKKKWNNVRL